MEMKRCDAFDYWGQGTEVTVQSETARSPSLFPLVQCTAGTESEITVGCLANNFSPKSISFQWHDGDGSKLTSVQYPPAEANNVHTGVSLVKVSKLDWNSRKSFTCSATHAGSPKTLQVQKPLSEEPANVILLSVPSEDTQALVCTIEDSVSGRPFSFKWKKNGSQMSNFIYSQIQQVGELYSAVSVLKVSNTEWDSKAVYTCEATYKGTTFMKNTSKAPMTVALSQPSPRRIFNDNQAELNCLVTGQDIDTTEVTWQIDGQTANGSLEQATKLNDGRHRKISTMTLSYTEWKRVNKVRCSASRDHMTPVIQDLTVHRGDGSAPKVAVHILPEEGIDLGDSAEVTMVCLVSAAAPQDYYITWSEHNGQQSGNYVDGVDFPSQRTAHGYAVTSVYTTTKSKWEQKVMFYCHVWPAGSNMPMKSRGVSKATDIPSDSTLSFALGCTDDNGEEDEFSSLWSTTSSFIFLFISSLFYNMIFSLVKMKRQ